MPCCYLAATTTFRNFYRIRRKISEWVHTLLKSRGVSLWFGVRGETGLSHSRSRIRASFGGRLFEIIGERIAPKGRSPQAEHTCASESREHAAVTHIGNSAVAKLAEAQIRGLRAQSMFSARRAFHRTLPSRRLRGTVR